MVKIRIFSLFGEILLHDAGVENQIDKIDRKAQSAHKSFGTMTSTVGKWAIALGAAAVAGLGLMGKSAIEGASNLEGYRNTLNVVMKDTKLAGETFAWAVDFANKTPFETDSIVQATVRLQSYGLKAREVMPSIGDMAGVMNKDIMSAVEAVADAQTGELERMKEFGITRQMIIDQGNKTMKGKELVNNKGQIVDQENFNKAMFSLMDEKFKGGMDLQANSFKGLWSTVTGVFGTSLAMMMGISDKGEVVIGGMFDSIKQKIKLLAETLTRWSTDGTIEKIGKTIQSVFTTIITTVQEWMGLIGDIINSLFPDFGKQTDDVKDKTSVFSGVLDGITGVLKFVRDNIELIRWSLIVLGSTFVGFKIVTGIIDGVRKAQELWTSATKAATIAQGWLNAAMAANPIGVIIVAIGLLVGAFVILWNNNKGFRDFFINMWKEICNFFTDTIPKAFNTVLDFAKNNWQELLTLLFNPIGGALALLYKLNPQFKAWVDGVFKSIKDGFFNIIDVGKNMVEGLWNGISDKAKWIKDRIFEFCGNVGKAFKNFFGIHSPSTLMAEYGKYLVQGLADGITEDMSAEEAIKKKAENLKTAFTNTLSGLSVFSENISLKLDNWLKGEGKSATETEKLDKEIGSLNGSIDIQSKKLDASIITHNKMVETYGTQHEMSVQAENDLLKEQGALQDLINKVQDLNTQKQGIAPKAFNLENLGGVGYREQLMTATDKAKLLGQWGYSGAQQKQYTDSYMATGGTSANVNVPKNNGGGVTQHITINSPVALSPYETARQTKLASQQLAMQMG